MVHLKRITVVRETYATPALAQTDTKSEQVNAIAQLLSAFAELITAAAGVFIKGGGF